MDGGMEVHDAQARLMAQMVDLIDYDPENGEFKWRKSRSQRRAGDRAGSYDRDGRYYIGLNRRKLHAGIIAWVLYYGTWPTGLVDHKDRNPGNNRADNLRLATTAENKMNSGPAWSNPLGLKGVTRRPTGRYEASIQAAGKKHRLGLFDTAEEAAAAYDAAAEKLHGQFAYLNGHNCQSCAALRADVTRLTASLAAAEGEAGRLREAAGKSYALLWRSMTDDPAAKHARGRLLAALTAEEQRSAIAWVISEFGEMSTSELIAADMRAGVFPRRSYDPDATAPAS